VYSAVRARATPSTLRSAKLSGVVTGLQLADDEAESLRKVAPWLSDPLKQRRTKIVATLGPASSETAVIQKLVEAGVNVFRLNFSHGDHASHKLAYERVRAAAVAVQEPVAVLADLCGPKIRVGQFSGGQVELVPGARVVVTTRDVVGSSGVVPSQYEALADDVRVGNRILLDDGVLELRVEAIDHTEVTCTVVHGGVLKDRKGMNLPGVQVSAPAFTDKDREDAIFALGLGVDFIALSFVRRAADFDELKSLLAGGRYPTHLIAKIEKPEALGAIDEIMEACDGIMVARGDLGVELPPEVVPIIQRQLITRARSMHKPAIVATQMLESMIYNPRPTRAEASDVSTAVFSGADAVMLSAESASGAHPVGSVQMLDAIARQTEGSLWTERAFGSITVADEALPPLPLSTAVGRSIAQLSRDLRVRCIVALSPNGSTAMTVAAARPAAPMIAASPDPCACRRMNLLWGTVPVQATPAGLSTPHAFARRIAVDLGFASEGQKILMIAGFEPDEGDAGPSITVLTV
jgi:pyruvate kinase